MTSEFLHLYKELTGQKDLQVEIFEHIEPSAIK